MLVGLMACALPMASPRQTVVTDHGLGPDKRATAWLMARHAVPGAELVVLPQGKQVSAGIAFDVPTSALRRDRDHAAFQVVMDHYRLQLIVNADRYRPPCPRSPSSGRFQTTS